MLSSHSRIATEGFDLLVKTSVVCGHSIPLEGRTRAVADPNRGFNWKDSLHSIFNYFRRDLFLTLGPAVIFLPVKADSSSKRTRGCGGGELGNKWNTVILLMTYIFLIKLFGCSQTCAFVRLICVSRLLPICDQEVKLSKKILGGVIFACKLLRT